jgi:alpha-galactosidase
VNNDKSKAVMFTYLHSTRFMETATERPIALNGLDARKKYTIKELNLYPGTLSSISPTQIYSGDFLMNVGLNPDVNGKRTSVVLEITEVK